MNPGKLDRIVTVQRLTETRDAAGGIVSTWTDIAPKIYAQRVDRGGREFRSSAAMNAEVTSIFTIRSYTGLTTKHRFVDAGITYDVVYVQQPNRTGYQDVQARAVNP